MKRVAVSYEEVKAFVKSEKSMVGWDMIEIPDPHDAGSVLIGIVHGHFSVTLEDHLNAIRE